MAGCSDTRFACLDDNRRVWAIASVFGKYDRLKIIHEVIASDLKDDDYIVYMGNMVGVGSKSAEVLDEIKKFKESLPDNTFFYLRGAQEEMWQKLLQLHLAHKPEKVYQYLLQNGVKSILESYGISPDEGEKIVEKGTVAISHWTETIRDKFYETSAYEGIFQKLKHAAYREDKRLLFVNAGVDHKLPLEKHKDEFWWADANSFSAEKPFNDFSMVVRAYAKGMKAGIYKDDYYLTLGSGEAPTAHIYAALFSENGVLNKAAEV